MKTVLVFSPLENRCGSRSERVTPFSQGKTTMSLQDLSQNEKVVLAVVTAVLTLLATLLG
jgi:hypothetical protein